MVAQTGARKHNLPSVPSSFVGRASESAELRHLLGKNRLVTVTGTGGVGKTRLAVETAMQLVDEYADGVWMVDLATISEAELLPKAVASGLQIREQPNRTIPEALVDQIGSRSVLLLLDNCEHLVQAVAELAAVLLRACPELRILATSREPLRVTGEIAWSLAPLSAPTAAGLGGGQEVTRFDAVQLFVERAGQAAPRGQWISADMQDVANICRRVDGVPLAIELAAARARLLAPREILERLDRSLDLLTRGDATALPRHQTLRATLDWSFRLLSNPAQILLRRLGVFIGGFSLDAAETVAAVDPIPVATVLDLLSQLVDKSIVIAEVTGGNSRYRLLETIREYALEQLRAAGEEELILTRHRDWCLALAEQAEPHLYLSEQVDWIARLDLEQANIRAALAYSSDRPDAGLSINRFASALGWFWYFRGHLAEGRRWLQASLSLASSAPHYAQAANLRSMGLMAFGQGDLASALSWYERSAAAASEAGDQQGWAHALAFVASGLRYRGRYQESAAAAQQATSLARKSDFRWGLAFALYQQASTAMAMRNSQDGWRLAEQSLTLFRELGDRLGTAYSLHLQSMREHQADPASAEAMNREALRISEELGNQRGVGFSLGNLGLFALRRGDDQEALEFFRRSLKLWRELGSLDQTGLDMAWIAAVLAAQQNKAAAVRLLGASEAILEQASGVMRPDDRADIGYDRVLAACRAALGTKAFEEHWTAGRRLGLDAAVEYALTCEVTPAPAASGRPRDPLSDREREVAVMLGRGLTNREIARELVISKQTVDRHVSNILSKLGFGRRSQIVAWLAEQRQGTPRPT